MYLLLLVFGGVLSAAGIALSAAGISLHDRTFDTTIVTPGVVAIVGGFLLIGLGLALRILQRIERTLAVRQVALAESAREPAPVPLPNPATAKPATRSPTAPPALSAEEMRAENLADQAPALADLESTQSTEETAPLPPAAAAPPLPTSVDLAVEAEKARSAKRKNGAAPARLTPRLNMLPNSPTPSGRPAGPSFDALWPKGPRPIRAVPPLPPQAATAAATMPENETESAAAAGQTLAPAAAAAPSPEPVSVLKSGVVDGMAYTLYSDGSIEAQLPQGTLRFGSITELRNHIEQSA
jgi:hypothetical protein